MKNKILLIAMLLLASFSFAQVIIGDNIGTATDKTSVLLEFSKEKKGIILPYVSTKPTDAKGGTIVYDRTDNNVKYYNGSTWIALTDDENSSVSITHQPNVQESSKGKVIIGNNTSEADGVLVLESTSKAMVLPQVEDTDDIVSPSPGMMVYLNKVKKLAVFSGAKWYIWSAE